MGGYRQPLLQPLLLLYLCLRLLEAEKVAVFLQGLVVYLQGQQV